ncbi:MAG TPA: septal ring lytic transglycosylase RlpA family protein [Myxococcales bacterium]|nr:septal ring lytic transglycosylase RlpA family protein [Myxococcales bacterium]
MTAARGRAARALALCAAVALGCAHAPSPGGGRAPAPLGERREGGALAEGTASFYGPGFEGRRTANGERFDPGALTAAHRTLPFGTCLRVRNLGNGREVEVRVNDRGPFAGGRILDVSTAAARILGMLESGLAKVRLFRCG